MTLLSVRDGASDQNTEATAIATRTHKKFALITIGINLFHHVTIKNMTTPVIPKERATLSRAAIPDKSDTPPFIVIVIAPVKNTSEKTTNPFSVTLRLINKVLELPKCHFSVNPLPLAAMACLQP
jgi:hypothetical protein